jgi:hypothetical protein
MVFLVFIPWVAGFMILYLAQKPAEKTTRIILRAIAFALISFPFAMVLYGMFFANL